MFKPEKIKIEAAPHLTKVETEQQKARKRRGVNEDELEEHFAILLHSVNW